MVAKTEMQLLYLGEICYLENRLFDLVQTPSGSIFDTTVLLSGSMA